MEKREEKKCAQNESKRNELKNQKNVISNGNEAETREKKIE